MQLGPGSDEPEAAGRSLLFALYGAVLAASATAITGWRGDWDIYHVDDTARGGAALLIGPVVGAAVGLLLVFLSRLVTHRFDWARHLHRTFRGLLGPLSGAEILILAIASAVGEELLFRGALMPWLGVVPSTVIFGLLHLAPRRGMWPWTLSSLAVGFALAGMAVWTGDLGAPIVAHFVINYMNIHYIVRVELPA